MRKTLIPPNDEFYLGKLWWSGYNFIATIFLTFWNMRCSLWTVSIRKRLSNTLFVKLARCIFNSLIIVSKESLDFHDVEFLQIFCRISNFLSTCIACVFEKRLFSFQVLSNCFFHKTTDIHNGLDPNFFGRCHVFTLIS